MQAIKKHVIPVLGHSAQIHTQPAICFLASQIIFHYDSYFGPEKKKDKDGQKICFLPTEKEWMPVN